MKATTRNMISPAKKPSNPVPTPKVAPAKIPPKNSEKRVNPEATIPMIPKITAYSVFVQMLGSLYALDKLFIPTRTSIMPTMLRNGTGITKNIEPMPPKFFPDSKDIPKSLCLILFEQHKSFITSDMVAPKNSGKNF